MIKRMISTMERLRRSVIGIMALAKSNFPSSSLYALTLNYTFIIPPSCVEALLIIPIVRDRPYPIRILKMGPAIVPAMAISPKPFLVIATSADMSPRQLPQAIMVNAKRESGIPVINCMS